VIKNYPDLFFELMKKLYFQERRPKASFLFSGFGANRLVAHPSPPCSTTQSNRGDGGDMGIPVQ